MSDADIAENMVVNDQTVRGDPPPFYNVRILDDPETGMLYVVDMLRRIFNKNLEDAQRIMMKVHKEGSAVCEQYTKDIAETKARQAMSDARKHGFPLQLRAEPA